MPNITKRGRRSFHDDDYPGAPKVLFVGWPNSPHTHSWINLLQDTPVNVRLFGLPTIPPHDWPVRTYMTAWVTGHNEANRYFIGTRSGRTRFIDRIAGAILRHFRASEADSIELSLRKVINAWKPNVIHTLGFDPASYLFLRVRPQLTWKQGQWVAQARGGPDLYLFRYKDDLRPQMEKVIQSCDRFIADNQWNYEFAESLGLQSCQKTPFGIVSGTGGTDIEAFGKGADMPPSKRERLIYMPKCYDTMAVRGHSALEGLRLAWPHIQPCRVKLSWITQPDFQPWVRACLGEDILKHCTLHEEVIPREASLQALREARVLYAPSVLDGVPNSMLEGMACGAFPIVSPLESIDGVVEHEKHVLFARNLYPEEQATALVRAMNDDELVDRAAEANKIRVRELSDRNRVRETALTFYPEMAKLGGWV
jgi:glycosyltransferase involved in cell wall biosynthesis